MLLVFADRYQLIDVVAPHPVSHLVELGVFEGEFSEYCYKALHPTLHTLIDFWDYDSYSFELDGSPQMAELSSIYTEYFGGDGKKGLSDAYEKTKARFRDAANVAILKMDIAQAAERFPDGSLDVIYLDANHTYEFVLRDLYTWFPKLRKGGLFICNDFFESASASRQNIGVIPAFTTFSKRFDVFPLALTAGSWSDLYFSNQPTSDLIDGFLERIERSAHPLVEIPDDLLGAYRHKEVEQNGRVIRVYPEFSRARRDVSGTPSSAGAEQ
jgi:Methyltransferase domain